MQPRAETLSAWPGVEEATIEVGGRQVNVLRNRRPGKGHPTLLVHGLAGSASTWIEVIEGLAQQTGGPVVAIDLPGFGHTPPRRHEHLTVNGYVRFVRDAVDALGWDRFDLHGNSMGGLISTLFSARYPARVSGLVLVSPAMPPKVPVGIVFPSRATMEGMGPIAMASFASAALAPLGMGRGISQRRNDAMLGIIYPSREAANPAVLRLMARDISDPVIPAEERRRALLSATRSIARHWTNPRHSWEAIAAISAPTLLLGGTKDALIPERVLRAVMARRRDWESHMLPGRRHALMLEEPATYLDLVAAWRAAASAA